MSMNGEAKNGYKLARCIMGVIFLVQLVSENGFSVDKRRRVERRLNRIIEDNMDYYDGREDLESGRRIERQIVKRSKTVCTEFFTIVNNCKQLKVLHT